MADFVEINQNHRMFLPFPFTVFSYPQAIEQFLFSLKQAPERGYCQGFAEPAGTGRNCSDMALSCVNSQCRAENGQFCLNFIKKHGYLPDKETRVSSEQGKAGFLPLKSMVSHLISY